MLQQYTRPPEFVTRLADGTVKQLNPFTGTEVWTVPGRGNRPLGVRVPEPVALRPDDDGAFCPFCRRRYTETPPEKSRMIRHPDGRWETRYRTSARALFDTVAEFRQVPNLFEILSYEYWHANYGYTLPAPVAERRRDYLQTPEGRAHVLGVVESKLRAAGRTQAQIDKLSADDKLDAASGFFGGGHDVLIARRHHVDGATSEHQLASSGTLTVEEHRQFTAYAVQAVRGLYDLNRYARYVAVYQNWLKPAGASFDHLHKQLVAIDERGVQQEAALVLLRQNPNLFNDHAVNYAAAKNLVIAENDHAVMFAGFGHRYPSIEVYSKSEQSDPWDHSADELAAMSDLLHAAHAATGADVPCNEEWHYRPVDVDLAMPWRVLVKWRVSTLAGFEGVTKIYLNTIDPAAVRDKVVPRLDELRAEGRIAGHIRIAGETECRPNPLRYTRAALRGTR